MASDTILASRSSEKGHGGGITERNSCITCLPYHGPWVWNGVEVRAVRSARKGSGQSLPKRVHGAVPWRMEKSLQGRQGEAGGPSRHRGQPGKGMREDEVWAKSFWAFKMGSVGCCVGCRDESLAVGAGSSVKGRASHLWSLGLVMVVKPLGSNLIQDLRQVTSQIPASVYPPVNGDNSSTTL